MTHRLDQTYMLFHLDYRHILLEIRHRHQQRYSKPAEVKHLILLIIGLVQHLVQQTVGIKHLTTAYNLMLPKPANYMLEL